MALTLPTLTIQDDAVVQKVMGAFSGTIDPATGASIPPAQAYKRWLRAQLIEHVAQMRTQQLADARKVQDEADLAAEREALTTATA